MQQVTLNVAATPIVEDTPVWVYELITEYMHGDDDGDTSRTKYFGLEEEDTLKLSLLALEQVSGRCDYAEIMSDVAMAQGIDEEQAEDMGQDFDNTFSEMDMTCEGEVASLTDVQLYWYDENGQRFKVDVVIK